jgi:hypothetical protein
LTLPCRTIVLLITAGALAPASAATADDRRESTIGMPVRIAQLVLPGSELEVKPLDDRKLPVVLRIVETYPHGTDFRYDLVYYGLDPGKFDLRDYLRRKDGSPTSQLPPLLVTIKPLLAPGQIEPHPLEITATPWLGGYRLLLLIVGVLWFCGLLAILLVKRGGKGSAGQDIVKPATLAERLRPLVEQAMAGKLTQAKRAELERSLLAYWRRRLKLEKMSAAEAIAVMREDAGAGPLLV